MAVFLLGRSSIYFNIAVSGVWMVDGKEACGICPIL